MRWLLCLVVLLPVVTGGHDTTVDALEAEVLQLTAANTLHAGRLEPHAPRGTWLFIDTGTNLMRLMHDDLVVLETTVATGSGVRLDDPAGDRSWVFATPHGRFPVLAKVLDPVWTKPDWAFIEAGEPIPESWSDRIEKRVLGDYALDLGDGYLIHGSLYERALGLHVTHGCVRVGSEALEAIFNAVNIGTMVYII